MKYKPKSILFITTFSCIPPEGAASRRIVCTARSLIDAGWNATVFQIRKGGRLGQRTICKDNIIYLCPAFKAGLISNSKWYKASMYLMNYVSFVLFLLYKGVSKNYDILYLYCDNVLLIKTTWAMGKLFNIPFVKELTEYRSLFDEYSDNKKDFYENDLFKYPSKFIVISEFLRQRVLDKTNQFQTNQPVFKMPILYEKSLAQKIPVKNQFFWCGLLDGYKTLVIFMINAFSKFKTTDQTNCRLVFAGRVSKNTKDDILDLAKELGVSDFIDILGFIEDQVLERQMASSLALLVPLENDDRSKARFPTKLAEFLSTERPVIASGIGEICSYLTNLESAYIAAAGCEDDWARNMSLVAAQTHTANCIGLEGAKIGFENFHYLVYSQQLDEFLSVKNSGPTN